MAGIIIISLVFAIFLILVCREIVCWYCKINIRIDLQKETNKLLRELIKKNNNYSESVKEIIPNKEKDTFYGDPEELKKALDELKG